MYIFLNQLVSFPSFLHHTVSAFSNTFPFQLQERSKILLKFADLLEKHNDELATLETWDNGKPYEQASKIEVPMVVRLFRYYAGQI